MTATITAPWFPVNSMPGSQSNGPFTGSQRHSWSFTMVTSVCMGCCFSLRHTSSQLSPVHFFQFIFTRSYLYVGKIWKETLVLCLCAFQEKQDWFTRIRDLWIFLQLFAVISKNRMLTSHHRLMYWLDKELRSWLCVGVHTSVRLITLVFFPESLSNAWQSSVSSNHRPAINACKFGDQILVCSR